MKSQVKKSRNLEPKKKSLEEAWKQLSSQYSSKKKKWVINYPFS